MAPTTHTTTRIATRFDLGEFRDGTAATYWLVALRLITGWWFLQAGVTKLLAPEPFAAGGWLANATGASPIHGLFVWVTNTPWLLAFTDVAIPVGETLIGLGLIVGALVRLAAFFGGVLMVLFYLGNADWAHGYVNGDLLGLVAFITIGTVAAGRVLGVDALLIERFGLRKDGLLRFLL
ncbi:DoxX family membrane protein [Halobaculum limi]|uniref:DoxX family membrane protein n=1 Tax=Halobaculum limi TaxID=3031916 RepID=UPI0024060A39|nr:TQO small subunit DoxD [Halobaculum sp. YSMS11]